MRASVQTQNHNRKLTRARCRTKSKQMSQIRRSKNQAENKNT